MRRAENQYSYAATYRLDRYAQREYPGSGSRTTAFERGAVERRALWVDPHRFLNLSLIHI